MLNFDPRIGNTISGSVADFHDDGEKAMGRTSAPKKEELTPKHPNWAKAMGRAILAKLRQWRHSGFVYVCGDNPLVGLSPIVVHAETLGIDLAAITAAEAIANIQDVLGGTNTEECIHGEMAWKEGEKNGR